MYKAGKEAGRTIAEITHSMTELAKGLIAGQIEFAKLNNELRRLPWYKRLAIWLWSIRDD